jgi:hypothetical protein
MGDRKYETSDFPIMGRPTSGNHQYSTRGDLRAKDIAKVPLWFRGGLFALVDRHVEPKLVQ